MQEEKFTLASELDGFAVGDTFTLKGRNSSFVQVVPDRRPGSVVSLPVDIFEGKFRLVNGDGT